MVSIAHPLIRELCSLASGLLDPGPIAFRPADELGVRPVRRACQLSAGAIPSLPHELCRNAFLCGCLDYTEHEPIEHLIVGLGRKVNSTTKVHHMLHALGSAATVALPVWIKEAINDFVEGEPRASVLIFHNHPQHPIRRLLDNDPLASDSDRRLLVAFRLRGLCFGRTDLFRFYIGENGFVREFRTPQLLDLWGEYKRARSGFQV